MTPPCRSSKQIILTDLSSKRRLNGKEPPKKRSTLF